MKDFTIISNDGEQMVLRASDGETRTCQRINLKTVSKENYLKVMYVGRVLPIITDEENDAIEHGDTTAGTYAYQAKA